MERATYKPLPTTKMRAGVVCQPPVVGPEPVKPDTPAIEVMTDLRQFAAARCARTRRSRRSTAP